MDPKELEDKLEKDNLTLKEHILKLQNTIKNIKTELSNTNNNTTYVNTLSQIDISTIKNSKVESPKNNGKLNNKDESDEEINNLKFSFKNIKAEQKLLLEENKRKKENSYKNKKDDNLNLKTKINYEEDYNSNENNKYQNDLGEKNKDKKIGVVNSHVYKDNFAKIKNEKDIIEKMESVRNTANLKKKYMATDSDDDSEYEKFHKLNKYIKDKNNYNNNDNYRQLNEPVNKFELGDYRFNNQNNDKIDDYMKKNFQDDSDNEEKNIYEKSTEKKYGEKNYIPNSIPKYPNSKIFIKFLN